jgi:hypothetical protein
VINVVNKPMTLVLFRELNDCISGKARKRLWKSFLFFFCFVNFCQFNFFSFSRYFVLITERSHNLYRVFNVKENRNNEEVKANIYVPRGIPWSGAFGGQ